MKRFNSLTEAELTALTEEEIRRYIDYACAENGVPLLPALPPEPQTPTFEADTKVYSLGHYLHFTTAEDAARVLEAIRDSNPIETDYLSTPTGVADKAISTRKPYLAINIEEAFSVERAAALKRDLEGAKSAQETYDKAKKEFDSAVSERQAYEDDIRGKVADAWEVRSRREARQRDFDRYVELADGDRRVAARFLQTAHRDARELLPDVDELLKPQALPAQDVVSVGREVEDF